MSSESRDVELGSVRATSSNLENGDKSAQAPADPNIVDWDGPDDPANPLNWPKSLRMGHVVLISVITLVAYETRYHQLQA